MQKQQMRLLRFKFLRYHLQRELKVMRHACSGNSKQKKLVSLFASLAHLSERKVQAVFEEYF